MNYLFLDLEKVKINLCRVPFEYCRVGLFARSKAAKRMITPDEPHSIYVLPEKKAAQSIIQAIAEILHIHPDARLAIVSPRKKLTAALVQLQTQFPKAKLLCKKRLSKKICRFIHPESEMLPENLMTQADDAEHAMIHSAAQRVTEAVAHVLPEFSEVFTLLKTSSIPPDKAWEAAILLLKKNHPKKKADLLRLLTQHTDIEKADEIIKKLRTKGLIHIDAAENVRYRC